MALFMSDPITKSNALDGKTGAKKWEFETGESEFGIVSSPAIGSDGTVHVGSGDGRLYALDGITGAKKWAFKSGDPVISSPAIGKDGTVFLGSGGHLIHALNGKTGEQIWIFLTGGAVSTSPAIGANGTVYFGSWDQKVYAVKTDSEGLANSPWPMRGRNAKHAGRASK